MKWITAISIMVATAAIVALLLAFKLGICFPLRAEDVTTSGDSLTAPAGNLFVTISNQTHKELLVEGILDGATSFGGAVIRDQHFGNCGIGVISQPGDHTIEIRILRHAPVVKRMTFTTSPNTTNHVAISIFNDEQNGFRIRMETSQTGFGIM